MTEKNEYYITGSQTVTNAAEAAQLAASNFPAVARHIGEDRWHVSFLATAPMHENQRPFMATIAERLRLESRLELPYRNWRGETSMRRLHPIGVTFAATEWHPEPQWLLEAYDLDKKAERTFALKDFNPLNFPQDYEAIGKKLLEIGAMCDDQEIARTAYDAATALASPVPTATKPQPEIGMKSALKTLRENQRQLDADGCEVGVSREALHMLLEAYDRGRETIYFQLDKIKAMRDVVPFRSTDAEPVLTGVASLDIGPLKEAWEKLYAASKDVQRILEKQKDALQAENDRLKDPGDGRPCTMDEFVAALYEDCRDNMERNEAIEFWLYGDWAGAFNYLSVESAQRLHAKSLPKLTQDEEEEIASYERLQNKINAKDGNI